MNHTTKVFARRHSAFCGSSALGITGPVIPNKLQWVSRLRRLLRTTFNPQKEHKNAVDQ